MTYSLQNFRSVALLAGLGVVGGAAANAQAAKAASEPQQPQVTAVTRIDFFTRGWDNPNYSSIGASIPTVDTQSCLLAGKTLSESYGMATYTVCVSDHGELLAKEECTVKKLGDRAACVVDGQRPVVSAAAKPAH